MAHINRHSAFERLVNGAAMAGSGVSSKDIHRPDSSGTWYNLAGIFALVALIGVGIAYMIDELSRQGPALPEITTGGPTVAKIIAGQKLAIPPAWFRYDQQRADGFSDQVDLQFALPIGRKNRVLEVAVRLVPNSRARPSARLLDAVYLHQFTPEQAEGPPGLIGKPLKQIDGFQAETVWYDPLAANPFVTKCIAPIADEKNASCIRTVQLSKFVSAIYVFDAEGLGNWTIFDQEAQKWLSRIGGLNQQINGF